MARKVKNCYGCPADIGTGCLLNYERDAVFEYIRGPKGCGHITVYSPKICCHKPKTQKEFFNRWIKLNLMNRNNYDTKNN